MTTTPSEREAAQILRELAGRVGNLEDRDRPSRAPTIIRTVTNTSGDADEIERVLTQTLDSGRWNETNWKTAAWSSYDRS